MENEFIKYLNSMNNASSGNENALAEAQVLNDFYHLIKVERKVGNEIYERLFEQETPKSVILTGHAGDGKTSILIQILNEIGYFENGKKPLQEVEIVQGKRVLFYVKDMSELKPDDQEEYFNNFLQAPKKGQSSIIVTNTGPLLNTAKRMISKSDIENKQREIEEFELTFLDYIDSSYAYDKAISLLGTKFKIDIINLAEIDNTYFIGEILEKLCNKELWIKCEACSIACEHKCHIYNNYRCIVRQKEKIKDTLEKIYFWLSESESRLTIRQMLSHISYAITGNCTCEEINQNISNEKNPLFKYSFANLLFGYKGTELSKDSLNIKAIRSLNELELDKRSLLKQDNLMFVKEDFSDFNEEIKKMLEDELKLNFYNLGLENQNSQELRKSFRRFYLLFSNNKDDYYDVLKQIFSEVYPMYYSLVNKQITRTLKNQVTEIVFKGLYKLLTGVSAKEDENTINITLRKNLEDIQNVQIVLGHFNKGDIEIIAKPNTLSIETTIKNNRVFIRIRNIEYEVTHESLEYLYKLKEGVIFTSYNPNFTFGLSKLKSDLVRNFMKDEDDIRLLIIKKNKVDKLELYLENGKLNASLKRW